MTGNFCVSCVLLLLFNSRRGHVGGVRRAGALRGRRVALRVGDAGLPDAATPAVFARRLRTGALAEDRRRAQLPLHAAAARLRARPRPARALRQSQ